MSGANPVFDNEHADADYFTDIDRELENLRKEIELLLAEVIKLVTSGRPVQPDRVQQIILDLEQIAQCKL